MGGKYVLEDDRTIPDTMQATFEFSSGKLISVNIMEGMAGSFTPYGFIEFRATKGNIFAAENDFKIVPAKPGQFQTWNKLTEEEEFKLDNGSKMLSDGSHPDSMYNLVRNFLDCIKSRKEPLCTLEEGHLSTTMAHIATISLITGERLCWDPVNEKFINSEKANSHLHYEYRKPWSL
jgi:predicted dehydrogenase